MGAVPASIANAASEWMRPWWDQAQSTMAALIGPIPQSSRRSGRQDLTGDRQGLFVLGGFGLERDDSLC